MPETATPCLNCRRDISADVGDACRKTVVVYRMDRDREPDADDADKVFVECPYCAAYHEYRCPAGPGRRP